MRDQVPEGVQCPPLLQSAAERSDDDRFYCDPGQQGRRRLASSAAAGRAGDGAEGGAEGGAAPSAAGLGGFKGVDSEMLLPWEGDRDGGLATPDSEAASLLVAVTTQEGGGEEGRSVAVSGRQEEAVEGSQGGKDGERGAKRSRSRRRSLLH